MNDHTPRYLLEFRLRGEFNWQEGSSFRRLGDARSCVDATVKNCQHVLEGRVFDWKEMAYRYYRTAFPFKP